MFTVPFIPSDVRAQIRHQVSELEAEIARLEGQASDQRDLTLCLENETFELQERVDRITAGLAAIGGD